jgi:hypothetical protein
LKISIGGLLTFFLGSTYTFSFKWVKELTDPFSRDISEYFFGPIETFIWFGILICGINAHSQKSEKAGHDIFATLGIIISVIGFIRYGLLFN